MEIFGIILSKSDIYFLSAAGGLFIVFITIIATRQSESVVNKKRDRLVVINNILTPFNDSLLNIEAGELNHIHILNSLFESQKTAIAHAKTIASQKKKKKIEKAWKDYEFFYNKNAKGQVLGMFMSFPKDIMDQQNKVLRGYIKKIIKEIKDI